MAILRTTSATTTGAHRRSAYPLLVGVAVGALVTGVLLPLLVDPAPEDVRGTAAAGAGQPGEWSGADGPLASTGPGPAGGSPDVTGSEQAVAGPAGVAPGADGRPAPGPGADPGTARRSTDQGVTADEVEVGFLLLSLGSLGDVGVSVPGVDPKQQRAAFEAYLADINAHGGINGRTLVGEYRTYDVTSKDSQRAACLSLARDAEVFAVVAPGGFNGAPQLCVTQEHGIPLIAADPTIPTEFYERSGGLLFTMFQGGDRMMRNWAGELDRLGTLRGRTIGVVGDDALDPGGRTLGTLVDTLARYGHRTTHRTTLSADLSTGSSEIPIEVQQMRAKGIDTVLIATNTIYATQFVQNADNQQWRPKWFVTDWSGGTNDPYGERMPASFDGAVGITTKRQGEHRDPRFPEPAPERECREVYETATGRPLERGSSEHGLTLQNCGLVRVLAAGARGAGPNLTRVALGAAIQRIGPIAVPVWAGGSFRPGKFDLSDLVRTVQFRRSCRCWLPIDAFRPSRT